MESSVHPLYLRLTDWKRHRYSVINQEENWNSKLSDRKKLLFTDFQVRVDMIIRTL